MTSDENVFLFFKYSKRVQRTLEILEELSQVVRQGCAQLGDSDICIMAQLNTCRSTQVATVDIVKDQSCRAQKQPLREVIGKLFLFLNT